MRKKIDERQMAKVLDTLYEKALNGIPAVSESVDELANDYLKKNKNISEAAKALQKNQIIKCGVSGFITGLGGLITLPIAIPANIGSVLYVQLRMIAAIAKIGGFDVHSDQVQTLVYTCLTGSAIADVLKQTGIKIGEKITVSTINKIPGKVLTSINQKVGFRLLTKFGTKGAVNLVKFVPVAGGLIGGGIDIVSTKVIAKNAYNIFIKKQIPKYKNYEDPNEENHIIPDDESSEFKDPIPTDATLSYYNLSAHAYAADTLNADVSKLYEFFLPRLPAHATILDLGCGPGRDSLHFLREGYRVQSIDGSPEFCKLASQLTGQAVLCRTFEDIDFTEEFDGIWACASILHVPSTRLPLVLENISRALKKGGHLYASFKYGTFEGDRNGRYFTDMTEETFEKLLASLNDLTIVETMITGDVREGREEEKWLNVLVRKG